MGRDTLAFTPAGELAEAIRRKEVSPVEVVGTFCERTAAERAMAAAPHASHFCGVFGIKPSFGRVPYYPVNNCDYTMHLGPIARKAAHDLSWNPAASVPCGFTAAGLPVGLQIVGRRSDDLGVLQAAAAFDDIALWGGRRLPLA